jgi:ABC-type transporter Mla MlaB component
MFSKKEKAKDESLSKDTKKTENPQQKGGLLNKLNNINLNISLPKKENLGVVQNNAQNVKQDVKNSVFGHLGYDDIVAEIDKNKATSGIKESSLVTPTITKSASEAVERARTSQDTSSGDMKKNSILAAEDNDKILEITNIYAEGDSKTAIELLEAILNKSRGQVDKKFWFMLMDLYQITNQQQKFEKSAILFANVFKSSPPSWTRPQATSTNSIVGKNVLLISNSLNMTELNRFKEFLKNAKEKKFARIDASKLKLETSDIDGLNLLLRTMYDLRKYKVLSVLMGENNLINIAQQYINYNEDTRKHLLERFISHEQIFWLLYLEVLQWKGRIDEFNEVAVEYAMKFEISPPGWEDKGVMKVEEESIKKSLMEEEVAMEKVFTSNNINTLFSIISNKIQKSNKVEIDFSGVERIEFSSTGALGHYLQQLSIEDNTKNVRVTLKHPNELVYSLLELAGITQFLNVIKKAR